MDNKKEFNILLNHLLDLADRAYYTSSYTFSDFLSEGELGDILNVPPDKWPIRFDIWGGHEDATRCMLRFGSMQDFGYEEAFPMDVLKITPINAKFAESLDHRDYLGSLMNMNIERKLLGDIIVGDKEAYLFCKKSISSFLMEEWTKVRHTLIKSEIVESIPSDISNETEEISLTVSSLRLDLVASKLCKLSRKEMAKYFFEKKVFVNGKNMTNSSYILKENDKISVRGFGKFIYVATNYTTKKGNLSIIARKYVSKK